MGRKNIYIKSASYSSVFENISAAGGSAEQIQRQANDEYYKMLALHPDLGKVALVHWKQC